MTYNQTIKLFEDWADAHGQVKTYGNGEEWEKEGILKAGILYPIFYTVATNSQTFENTIQRTFKVICFGQVKKDKSNENEVISDTEQIIHDFIKYLRYDSMDIDLIGDPVITPFKEEFGDWCAGWEGDIIIETIFANNNCDSPEA